MEFSETMFDCPVPHCKEDSGVVLTVMVRNWLLFV